MNQDIKELNSTVYKLSVQVVDNKHVIVSLEDKVNAFEKRIKKLEVLLNNQELLVKQLWYNNKE